MLKLDLVQTDKHSIKILLAEKSPIFTSHKSYKNSLCFIKKPAAQTAHLVFADTKANAEKTKRAVFCQRSKKN